MMALTCIEHLSNRSTTQQLPIVRVMAIATFLDTRRKRKAPPFNEKRKATNIREMKSFCFTFVMSIVCHGPANKLVTMIR